MLQTLDRVAQYGGVGGDDAVDLVTQQGVGDVTDLGAVDVGGDLQQQRHVAAMLVGEFVLPALEAAQ